MSTPHETVKEALDVHQDDWFGDYGFDADVLASAAIEALRGASDTKRLYDILRKYMSGHLSERSAAEDLVNAILGEPS